MLRVLIVEDSVDDAELVELELVNAGYQVSALRVDTEAAMQRALATGDWDLITSDHAIPGFGSHAALNLLKQSGRDIPFIIVSGTISEETAVASMRSGAHDYVLKDNLARLAPAVEREIQEVKVRKHKREAETALRESQARLEGIVQSAMDAIITVDEEQRIVLFNQAAEAVFKLSGSEALGSLIDRFIPAEYRDRHREHIRSFGSSGGTKRSMHSPGVLTAVRANGEHFPIEATISQIQMDGRKFFTVILRDVSERERAEAENHRLQAQLAQAQKLEAIGQLAGGIAHDFNTVLNIISGYAELLMAELPPGDPRRERVEQIAASGRTGALLTKQLLAFSRKQAIIPQILDLRKVVLDLQPMLQRLVREDIRLVVHCPDKANAVKADAGQIQQVILNLAANARDAMPNGGSLTIEVKSVELDEQYAHTHASVRPGSYEMLAVTDTGCGMTPDTVARIFEPFFTTKSVGHGTGLGLATVYGIVKQSGGNIWVYSEPGVGTSFKLYFPRSFETTAPATGPIQTEPKNLSGTETILLVEDSDGLRHLTCEILSVHGYTVLEASDGAKALELSSKHSGPIDLLLTDIVMPDVRGPEVATHIAQQRRGIGVVFVSGYSEEALSNIPGAQRISILEKPYTAESLLRAVRQALDNKQRTS